MSATRERITSKDLEEKFAELQGRVDEQVQSARSAAVAVGIAVVVVLVLGSYLLGRRRGRKRRTVLEVRRI